MHQAWPPLKLLPSIAWRTPSSGAETNDEHRVVVLRQPVPQLECSWLSKDRRWWVIILAINFLKLIPTQLLSWRPFPKTGSIRGGGGECLNTFRVYCTSKYAVLCCASGSLPGPKQKEYISLLKCSSIHPRNTYDGWYSKAKLVGCDAHTDKWGSWRAHSGPCRWYEMVNTIPMIPK